ncbi:MAG: hypothetical protein ACLFM3_09135 [Desulfohalobiaceae bacterium]
MSVIQGGLTGMENHMPGTQGSSYVRQPSQSAMHSSRSASSPIGMEAPAGAGMDARTGSTPAQAGQEQEAAKQETEGKTADLQAANAQNNQKQPSEMLPEDSTLRQMQMQNMVSEDNAQQTGDVQEPEQAEQPRPEVQAEQDRSDMGVADRMAESLPGATSGVQQQNNAALGGLAAGPAAFAGQTGGELLSRTV